MIGCVESKTRNHIILEAWFVKCRFNINALLTVLLIDRSQPSINPTPTIEIGANFRFSVINSGVDWTGMTHSIDEPIMIDIIAIITIGVAVEGFSVELNNGK